MTKLANKTGVAIGLCAALAAGAARADVIYSASIPNTGIYNNGTMDYSFDLTNAQVATGAFHLVGRGSPATSPTNPASVSYTGDVGGFSSLVFPGDNPVTPSKFLGFVSTDLTFDPATDALETISIDFEGYNSGSKISGTGSNATINFASDDPYICPAGDTYYCNFTGVSFTTTVTDSSVPEPASFAVLGLGLLGMAAVRRHA